MAGRGGGGWRAKARGQMVICRRRLTKHRCLFVRRVADEALYKTAPWKHAFVYMNDLSKKLTKDSNNFLFIGSFNLCNELHDSIELFYERNP